MCVNKASTKLYVHSVEGYKHISKLLCAAPLPRVRLSGIRNKTAGDSFTLHNYCFVDCSTHELAHDYKVFFNSQGSGVSATFCEERDNRGGLRSGRGSNKSNDSSYKWFENGLRPKHPVAEEKRKKYIKRSHNDSSSDDDDYCPTCKQVRPNSDGPKKGRHQDKKSAYSTNSR